MNFQERKSHMKVWALTRERVLRENATLKDVACDCGTRSYATLRVVAHQSSYVPNAHTEVASHSHARSA